MAVDGEHIYWANEHTGTIGRAKLNGEGPDQSFITGADEPFGVAVDGEHIYWGNLGSDTIGRAKLRRKGAAGARHARFSLLPSFAGSRTQDAECSVGIAGFAYAELTRCAPWPLGVESVVPDDRVVARLSENRCRLVGLRHFGDGSRFRGLSAWAVVVDAAVVGGVAA